MHSAMGDAPHQGVLCRLLCLTAQAAVRRPWGMLAAVALVTVISLGITARFLSFKTSRADLINPEAEFHQRWLDYVGEFGEESDIVLVVESQNPARVRSVMDELGNALKQDSDLFDRITWKFDPASLQSKGLQYLTPQDLEQGLTRLEELAPILDGHWDRAGLEAWCRRITAQAAAAGEREDHLAQQEALLQGARLARSLTDFINSVMAGGAQGPSSGFSQTQPVFHSPWTEILPVQDPTLAALREPRYQVIDDGTMGFVTSVAAVDSQDFSGTSRPITRIRELVREARTRHPDVFIAATGIPILEAEEMLRSQEDMTQATIISLVGVALLLLVGFRGLRHPAMGLVTLGVGMSWSLGFITLSVGHLNILSVSFAAILVGLGIDFAIHFIAHYLELRQQGATLEAAIVETTGTVGTGIVTAGVTTALAFFCATFTNFLGVAELGLIAGGGIVLCVLATFLVLPALLAVADRDRTPQHLPSPVRGDLLSRFISRRPAGVALSTLAVLAVVGLQAFDVSSDGVRFRVNYDGNLLNLQANDVESVDVQKRMFERSRGSLLYAVSLANSPEEARQRAAAMERLPSVSHVEHLAAALPRYPHEEMGLLVQAFGARLARISSLPKVLPHIDPAAIGEALEALLASLARTDDPRCREACQRIDRFLDQLEAMPLETQVMLLEQYQQAMLRGLFGQLQMLAAIANPQPVNEQDLAPGYRERFVGSNGRWLLRIFPKEQIWDEEPLARFVADVRTIDPDATGSPIQNLEASRQIRQSYFSAALYALAVIAMVLLIDSLDSGPRWLALIAPCVVTGFAVLMLRQPGESLDPMWLLGLYVATAFCVATIFDWSHAGHTFLALLPPVGGMLLMFGILAILGIDLNPANLIVLPLILGIGVDDGVHVVHDYRQQAGSYLTSGSTINAVTMTSLTSMVGFGSMLGASHQGLTSLGLVLVIGVGSCLFISLVPLPALLSLVARWKSQNAEVTAEEPSEAHTTADDVDVAQPQVPPVVPLPQEKWLLATPQGESFTPSVEHSSPAAEMPAHPRSLTEDHPPRVSRVHVTRIVGTGRKTQTGPDSAISDPADEGTLASHEPMTVPFPKPPVEPIVIVPRRRTGT